MTEQQLLIVRRLSRVTMPVASFDKRFRRSMEAAAERNLDLTERQMAYLLKLDHRYRRQTDGAHVCGELCATYGRRRSGECFDTTLPVPSAFQRAADRRFLKSMGISPDPHAPLPLFDEDRIPKA